jgi:hypothetical protein
MRREAAQEMKGGPSKSAYRRRNLHLHIERLMQSLKLHFSHLAKERIFPEKQGLLPHTLNVVLAF